MNAVVLDESPMLTTEIATDPLSLQRLRPQWGALNEAARAGCIFLGYEWIAPWWQQFGEGRELRVICVKEGGQLVGLLPLFSERVRLGGIEVERLAFIGDGATGADYLDVLAAPGREDDVLEACLAALGGLDWDLLDLDGLRRDSPTAVQLAARFPSGRAVLAGLGKGRIVRDGRLRYVCPNITLTGSYEQYLQSLGRRENLKRREKWLFRQPGVSIQCAKAPQEAQAATEHFFALHRDRWAVEGGSDGLNDERHERFHAAATQLLAEKGWLRMYTLFAARRPVASVYGVVHRGKFLYYQSGYAPLWASRSVGLVLLARTVSDAFGEGLAEFDFLRGNEGYKAQWARSERWTIQLRLWRGARGRAAKAASGATQLLRAGFKAALPSGTLETVRAARRIVNAKEPLQAAMQMLKVR